MLDLKSTYPELGAGGITRWDGTVQFYIRVQALLQPEMTVLDYGAGRGRLHEDEVPIRRDLITFKGKVSSVIGIDVDSAVLLNPLVDAAAVIEDNRIPLADGSVDLILSDHVFEHLADPQSVASEMFRVLRPGGWLCARTPHSLSLVALAGRMVPSRHHSTVVELAQPNGRSAEDVFPTFYRLNSLRALNRYFSGELWENFSYTWSPEAGYHFNSSLAFRVMTVIQALKRTVSGEVLLVFLRKRDL